jgi:hypothetical protein
MEVNESNFGACIARIAARGSIGKEEARALLESVGERADEMRRTGLDNPVVSAAWELSQKIKVDAAERKADALLNAGIRNTHIAEATRGGLKGAVDHLLGTLYWQPGTQLKDNVQSMARTLTHQWLSSMHAQLEKAGLLKVIASRDMFREIANEVWNLRTGMAFVNLPTNSPARQIAQTIFEHQEAMRKRLNAAGARIANATDWIATTSHDDYLIRRGGRGQVPEPDYRKSYERWRDFVTPLLDESTYKDVIPKPPESEAGARERFLQGVYNALVTGVHLTEHREPGGTGPAFEGSFNIARSISQGRVLMWKNADGWSSYIGQYGKSRDWYSLMSHAAERAGRQSSLMEMWGTNPAGNLKLVTQRLAEQFRDKDPDGLKVFQKQVNSRYGIALDNVMEHLDGRSNIATNEMFSSIFRTIRAFYNTVYLGGVAFTHAGSLIATFPTEARVFGVNAFEGLGHLMKSMVPDGMKAAERADMLAELGAYGEGVSRHAFDAFAQGSGRNAPGWGIPGFVAAAQNRFMTATGLPWLFDHAKRGIREMVANKLGRQIGEDFSALAPKLQQTLRSYGIGETEWEMLRSGQLTKTPNGGVYLTPRAAKTIDDATVEASLRSRGLLSGGSTPAAVAKLIDSTRQDMADRLAMLYEDAADHSVVHSGVRERAFLQGKMPQGSWQSELLAGIMQFKTWPIAAMHQVMGREFYQSMSKTDAAVGALMVVGLSMLGGYLRMTARDIAYGQPPRVPRNVGEASKIALAALAQGGGLGIFGDLMFGEANRMGASNLSSFGGPVATDVSTLYGIYNRYLQSIGSDQKGDIWPELAKFGINHVPFANLFYLKQTLDYGLWFHLFEAMKPGWWERSNRRELKEQGRARIGYKPGAPIPYLPPALQFLHQ